MPKYPGLSTSQLKPDPNLQNEVLFEEFNDSAANVALNPNQKHIL